MKTNMQRGSLPLIIAILVIVVGGGSFLLFRGGDSDTSNDEVMEDKENMTDGEMMEKDGEDSMMGDGSHDGSMIEDGVITDEEMKAIEDMEKMNGKPSAMVDESPFAGQVLAGNTTLLIDYNKADYEKALKEKKLVVLYFYADWCPVCKDEVKNGLYPAFNKLDNKNVVGFRVNYNDKFTDNNEKDLAKEFGVAYQHTKVFLNNGERVLKSPESWSQNRYLEEINKAL
jgi:thioredoxin 1